MSSRRLASVLVVLTIAVLSCVAPTDTSPATSPASQAGQPGGTPPAASSNEPSPTGWAGAMAVAASLPVVEINSGSDRVSVIAANLGGGRLLTAGHLGSPFIEKVEVRHSGTIRPGQLLDFLTPGWELALFSGADEGARAIVIAQPPAADTELLGVSYRDGRLVTGTVRVIGAPTAYGSVTRYPVAPSLDLCPNPCSGMIPPGQGSALLLDRSGALVGLAAQITGGDAIAPSSAVVASALERLERANDVDYFVRPRVQSWRPTDATALTVTNDTLTAIDLTSGAQMALATFRHLQSWSMRSDGASFVGVVEVGFFTTRLVTWEPSTGRVRWLTQATSRVRHLSPLWGPNGSVYFGRVRDYNDERGVFNVRADGSGLARIPFEPAGPFLVAPAAVTSGGNLYLSLFYEGQTLAIYDMRSQASRDVILPPRGPARLDAIRSKEPEALISGACSGTGCLPPAGLAVLDGISGRVTELLDVSVEVAGADWDPSGTQVVGATRAAGTREVPALRTMNDRGGGARTLLKTEGATAPRWTRAGIRYLWSEVIDWETGPTGAEYPAMRGPYELRLVDPVTEATRTILRSDSHFTYAVVGQ